MELRRHFRNLRDKVDVGIAASIECLKRFGEHYPVCIVTGSGRRDAHDAVALMGIGDRLAFVLSADDYSPGKPDPACFLMAAEMLETPPEQCVVFEDSAAGIESAKGAGMRVLGLAHTEEVDRLHRADRVLPSLEGVPLRDVLALFGE